MINNNIKMNTQSLESIIKNDYNTTLTELLREEYPYLHEQMQKDNYIIEYNYFDEFIEIKQDNKTVGFYTTVIILAEDNDLFTILEELYILPEYWDDELVISHIMQLQLRLNGDFHIRNPHHKLIETLINRGLAVELDENIIYSPILLFDEYYNVYTECKIAKSYDFEELDYTVYTTNLYDLKHSTVIAMDDSYRISNQRDILILSTPRKHDMDKYNLVNKLKKIDKNYAKKVRKIINKQQEKMETSDQILEIYTNSFLNVEEQLGTKDKASELFLKSLKEHNIGHEDGIELYNLIYEAYENKQIDQKSFIYRTGYVLHHPQEALKHDNNQMPEANKCPYCNNEIDEFYTYCEECGQILVDVNLWDDEDEEDADEYTIDEKTGLEVGFQEKIIQEGYNPEEVYKLHFEMAVYQFLEYIDSKPGYPGLPNFDHMYHIRENSILDFLEDTKYIEKKKNNKYNPDISPDIDTIDLLEDNYLEEYIYKITKKGRRYYKKNKIAHIYDERIKKFEYYEFYYYCQENTDKKLEENADNFIISKYKESFDEDDEELYLDLLDNELLTYISLEDKRPLCVTILKMIIVSINIYNLNQEEDTDPIRDYIMLHYSMIHRFMVNYNIDELYEEAFESIELDKLRINKEKIRTIVKRLRHEDINEINSQLKEDSLEILN